MEEIKLWKIVDGANEKPQAVPVEKIAQTTTEERLETMLTESPELLIPGLELVGRQTPTPTGPLDLLGVDDDGQLVVFELKRGKLTRDAIAQAIDYASYLAGLEPEELCRCINENSRQDGTHPPEDFRGWYEREFRHRVADIGPPRIVLVGLEVDECAKRMVGFLANCELDISLITFHGFKYDGETLLARQVEVESRTPVGLTKEQKKAELDKLLATLGIEQNYEALIAALKQGLDGFAYQLPNPSGYSFFLPVAESGGRRNRSYIGLFVSEATNGKIQICLQARAIAAASENRIKEFAEAMGSDFKPKPGYGEIWIDGHKPAATYAEKLTALGKAISDGWKAKVNEATAEAQ